MLAERIFGRIFIKIAKESIMELAGIVFVQVVMIFLLLSVGFMAYRIKLIKDEGIKQITDVLLRFCFF